MKEDRIENIGKRIDELTRRVDKITTDLYASDSEYALRKIPELEKQQDNIVRHTAMNNIEIKIHGGAITSLQKAIYPISEAFELEKMKKATRCKKSNRKRR